MSHKNAAKVVWDILIQLSYLQVSGRWRLASGCWSVSLVDSLIGRMVKKFKMD